MAGRRPPGSQWSFPPAPAGALAQIPPGTGAGSQTEPHSPLCPCRGRPGAQPGWESLLGCHCIPSLGSRDLPQDTATA